MPRKRTAAALGVLCATTLSLTLALAGCDGQAESTTPTNDEQTAEKTDDTTSVQLSDQEAQMVEIVDELVNANDTTGADEFDSIPTEQDDQVGQIENADGIDTGEEDASKAPNGKIRLMGHGAQLLIPDTWFAMNTDGGIQFFNREGTIIGDLADEAKRNGETIDVEQLVMALPMQLRQSGFQNIRVVGQDTGYSDNGTLCAASICLLVNLDAYDEYVFFVQFVESKSYLTRVIIQGERGDFAANISDINAIIDSLQFNAGEAI